MANSLKEISFLALYNFVPSFILSVQTFSFIWSTLHRPPPFFYIRNTLQSTLRGLGLYLPTVLNCGYDQTDVVKFTEAEIRRLSCSSG